MPDDPYLVPNENDPNRAALRNPRVRRFLDQIGRSEGADYNTLVGGRKVADLSRHPNVVGLRTSAGPSTAFGKYQIVGSTDRSKLRKYRHLDYSPENQDVRAVELLRQTRALEALEQGDEATAIRRAGREWASLPGSPLPGRKNTAAFRQAKQDPYLVSTSQPEQAETTTDPYLVADQSPRFPPGTTRGEATSKRRELIEPQPSRGLWGMVRQVPRSQQLPQRFPRGVTRGTATSEKPGLVGSQPDMVERIIMEPRVSMSPESEAARQVEEEFGSLAGQFQVPLTRPFDVLTRSREQVMNEEVQRRVEQQRRSQTPEVIAGRQKLGSVPGRLPTTAIPISPRGVATAATRFGGGLSKVAAGTLDLVVQTTGTPIDKLKEYLNKQGEFLEDISSQPLNAQGEAIERQLPEKATEAVADLGLTVTQLALMKRATGLPLSTILATETALRTSDKPLRQRAPEVATAYGMGKILDQHLSRPASALLFGGPTAVTSGLEVVQGNMTLEDALLHTGVEAGAGAILAGRRRPEVKSKRQVETQPNVAEKPESAQPAGEVTTPVLQSRGGESPRPIGDLGLGVPEAVQVGPQPRWQHRDFGLVTESPNQANLSNVHVRVVDRRGAEHVIRRPKGNGQGNNIAIPIREQGGIPPETSAAPSQKPAAVPPIAEGAAKVTPSPAAEAAPSQSNRPIQPMESAVESGAMKQPHEMTRRQYVNARVPTRIEGVIGTNYPGKQTARAEYANLHRERVKTALAEGRPVPPEVLKDYPDLAAATKSTAQSEMKPSRPDVEWETVEVGRFKNETAADRAVDVSVENRHYRKEGDEYVVYEDRPKATTTPAPATPEVSGERPLGTPAEQLRRMPTSTFVEEWTKPASKQRFPFNDLLAEAKHRGYNAEGKQVKPEQFREPEATAPKTTEGAGDTPFPNPKTAGERDANSWHKALVSGKMTIAGLRSVVQNLDPSRVPESVDWINKTVAKAEAAMPRRVGEDATTEGVSGAEGKLAEQVRNAERVVDELAGGEASARYEANHPSHSSAKQAEFARQAERLKLQKEEAIAKLDALQNKPAAVPEVKPAPSARLRAPEGFEVDRPEKGYIDQYELGRRSKELIAQGYKVGVAEVEGKSYLVKQRIVPQPETKAPPRTEPPFTDAQIDAMRKEAAELQPQVFTKSGERRRRIPPDVAKRWAELEEGHKQWRDFGRKQLAGEKQRAYDEQRKSEEVTLKRAQEVLGLRAGDAIEIKNERQPDLPAARGTFEEFEIFDSMSGPRAIIRGTWHPVEGGTRPFEMSVSDLRDVNKEGRYKISKGEVAPTTTTPTSKVELDNKTYGITERKLNELVREKTPVDRRTARSQRNQETREANQQRLAANALKERRPLTTEVMSGVKSVPPNLEPLRTARAEPVPDIESQIQSRIAAEIPAHAPDFVKRQKELLIRRELQPVEDKPLGKQAGAVKLPEEEFARLVSRGWDIYDAGKKEFKAWLEAVKKEFGHISEDHLRATWLQLSREKAESTTSARKAQFAGDRAELDLPELPAPERKSWQRSLDEAKAKGIENASILADEVLAKPRSLNDVQTAQLVLRAQEIKNRHAEVMREIGEATGAEAIQGRRAEVDALEREFDRLTQATKASGTEKGRTLAAQKLTINQDYDLVSMKQRLKAAKGRDLTPKEDVRVAEQSKRITELERQLVEANERAETARLQKTIDRVKRQTKRSETKAVLDEEFAVLKSQLAQAKLETRSGVQPSLLAALDPEGKLTPIIAKMARNRVKAGVNSAESLIEEVYQAVKSNYDVAKDDIAQVIRGTLHQPDDVLSRWDKTRQGQLIKQQTELQQRLATGDFSIPSRERPIYNRETARLQRQVDEIKQRYNRELYQAKRSTGGKITDELAKAAGVGKTIKSMGDISAVFRQGGFYAVTHPIRGLAVPFRDMVRSFSDAGYRNVESAIKSHPKFERARKDGVEFTGVDRNDPNLSKHEEGYLGREYLDYVPVAKQVSKFSERTFVSFLDSQRMNMYDVMTEGLTNPSRISRALGAKEGLSRQQLAADSKRIAKAINSGTGRGNLGTTGNQIAPVLNIAMFSPRLLKSRIEVLNNMFNPVAWARMPRNARAQILQDNAKFMAATVAVLTLAKSVGADVSLDPDDSEFLKVRVGNTTYDILTGLQQPMRYLINMTRAATGGETYTGKTMKEMTSPFEPGSFTRSKLSPTVGTGVSALTGSDFLGRKFSAKREAVETVTPLPAGDVIEAFQKEGLLGAIKATPTFVGVSISTHPPSPEKPTTHAEKLIRKMVRDKMPEVARTEEEIERSRQLAELRARSRQGEDVTKELDALKVTDRQRKSIEDAKGQTRLQEGFKKLSLRDALTVYRIMTRGEQNQVKETLAAKAERGLENLDDAERERIKKQLAELGMTEGPRQRKERQPQEPRQPRPSPRSSYTFQ